MKKDAFVIYCLLMNYKRVLGDWLTSPLFLLLLSAEFCIVNALRKLVLISKTKQYVHQQ
jgi:hypothetical protein